MIRTHKIALDPNDRQRGLLAQHAGFSRVAFNWGLARFKAGLDRKDADGKGQWLTAKEISAAFTREKREEYPWCAAMAQEVGYQALRDLDAALHNWRGKKKDGSARKVKARFPRFKKRGMRDSFRTNTGSIRPLVVDGRPHVRLPKMGAIRLREPLRLSGKLETATVSRSGDRWFVSLTYDDGVKAPPVMEGEGPRIGVDLGIKTLAVAADTEGWSKEWANPTALRDALKRLRRRQKSVSRSRNIIGKSTPSTRRKRTLAQVAALHRRVADVRKDAQHRATTEIVLHAVEVGAVMIRAETLNVKGMLRNKRLARAIADAGFAEMLRQLAYKAEAAGIAFEQVDWFYPSSRLCSECGYKNALLTLADRRWECASCGVIHNRDRNAALNLARGTKEDESRGGSGPGDDRGDARPSSAGSSGKSPDLRVGSRDCEPRTGQGAVRSPIRPGTAAETPSNDTTRPEAEGCASAPTQPKPPRALADG